MDKIRELLKILNNLVSVEELDAALGAADISAVEWSDEIVDNIKAQTSSLLSEDAALNNPNIIDKIINDGSFTEKIKDKHYSEIKAKVLHGVEKELAKLGDKLQVDFDGKETAFEMIEKLQESEISAPSDEKTAKLLESYKSDLEKVRQEMTEKENEYKTKLSEQEKSFKEQELLTAFNDAAKTYKWADSIDDNLRGALLNQVWSKMKAKAEWKLVDGEITPFQKDLPDKELYDGNVKQTFKTMFEPEIQSYLKKSDPPKAPEMRVSAPQKNQVSDDENTEMVEFRKQRERMFSESEV